MKYRYKTRGVCASEIEFDIDNDIITNIKFYGGCNGNLKAISKLCEGKSGTYIVYTLKGNTCGFKDTSCADQLAIAIEKAKNEAQ